jgi:hypothetical protein
MCGGVPFTILHNGRLLIQGQSLLELDHSFIYLATYASKKLLVLVSLLGQSHNLLHEDSVFFLRLCLGQ